MVLNQDMGLCPAWCQPAAPGPHLSDLHERGSRQPPGKITSSLEVTFCGLGRRTGGPDPFKEPPLQAETDRHRATQSAICRPRSWLCSGFFLKQKNLLFQASDSEHPF